ncbi:MAG: hypothetical protein GY835_09025 [bacterium]|nr:hypothetical protein [bacterium]
MRAWFKLLVTFGAGAVLGAVASGLLVGSHWEGQFADSYALGVADQANVAREIYAGRSSQLAARIVDSLPQYVLALDREFNDAKWTQTALFMVQDVYRESGNEVPGEIRQILAALPSKPTSSCVFPPRGER